MMRMRGSASCGLVEVGPILLFSIQTNLLYSAASPCDLLLQIEAVEDDTQACSETDLTILPNGDMRVIEGEEHLGHRRWIAVEDKFECSYFTRVRVERPQGSPKAYAPTPLPLIPSDVTKFLMPSRYCHPEAFLDFVPGQFGQVSGGSLIAAISDWIKGHFSYDNGASNASTTATESFANRAGVCRDYAHVLIAMARAVGIPARFVSCYAVDVKPQDFHAVAEVYLAGQWHLVDPTGMAQAPEIIRIGVGRDAADVSFMTSYGRMELINQSIQVLRLE